MTRRRAAARRTTSRVLERRGGHTDGRVLGGGRIVTSRRPACNPGPRPPPERGRAWPRPDRRSLVSSNRAKVPAARAGEMFFDKLFFFSGETRAVRRAAGHAAASLKVRSGRPTRAQRRVQKGVEDATCTALTAKSLTAKLKVAGTNTTMASGCMIPDWVSS